MSEEIKSDAPKARRMRHPLPVRTRPYGHVVALALSLAAMVALWTPGELIGRTPVAAPEAQDDGHFSIYWGGLSVGQLSYVLSVHDGRYTAQASAKAHGLIDTLFKPRLEAEGDGARNPSPKPERYAIKVRFGDDVQAVRMRFGPQGEPAAVVADPPWKPRPWQIEPEDQAGALDPLSAAALFLAPMPPEGLCDGTVEVFDGRRRSRISLSPPAPHGPGWRCHGAWERVGGYKPEDMERGPVPLRADFAPRPDGLAQLIRVEADTGWGMGVVLRDPQ